MESTNQPEVKDCNTCTHHVQGGTLDDAPSHCWDCSRTKSLVHWEPLNLQKEVLKRFNSNADDRVDAMVYAALHGAEEETTSVNALDVQVGGGHYKNLAIQPMEYSMKNKLDACQHTAIKYVTRFREKGGKEDLEKAKHAIDLLIEFEYGADK